MRLVLIAALLAAPALYADPAADALDQLTRTQDFVAKRASSANEDLTRNGDARGIDKGQTLVLAELDGPSVVAHIWCTIGSYDPFHGRSLVLRAYWDGAEKPSVQVPLGDFFGVGHGAMIDYTSAPACVTSNGRARVSFWRMPFLKSAKITITNESDTYDCDSFYYYIDWEKHEALPADTVYFHAAYRQEFPVKPGDYTLLETTGRGHYAGTLYNVVQMENGWFGEGDDRFYVDGEEYPSLSGTGTEDYFNDAWGFRRISNPYYGVSVWDGYFAGDRVSAYRWHIPDPVPFKKSLKVAMEHKGSIFTDGLEEQGGFLDRSDWISSVAYWYQAPATGLDPLPPAAERIPPYKVFEAASLDVRVDPPGLLTKDKTVQYISGQPNASLEIDFEIAEKGHYVLSAAIAHALISGMYQPFIDGKSIGVPMDFIADGMDILYVPLDTHVLEAGKHTLRFEGRGPSPGMRSMSAPMYAFGIHYLITLRLEDMPGYQEGLKKVQAEKANK